MSESKIAQLRENVGTWTTNDGKTLYKHNVQLENGVQGTALGQTPTAPYQVGDLVTYTEHKNQNGTRLKIRKGGADQVFQPRQGGSGQNTERDARIMRQTAMKVAAHVVPQGQPWSAYLKCAEHAVAYFKNGIQDTQQNAASVAPQQVETRTPAQPFANQTATSDDLPF